MSRSDLNPSKKARSDEKQICPESMKDLEFIEHRFDSRCHTFITGRPLIKLMTLPSCKYASGIQQLLGCGHTVHNILSSISNLIPACDDSYKQKQNELDITLYFNIT